MTGKHMGHTTVRGNLGGIPLKKDDVTVAQVLKKAWLSYTKADLTLLCALDLTTLKTFTEVALHERLLALLPASGLAREIDGQWMLQAQAD